MRQVAELTGLTVGPGAVGRQLLHDVQARRGRHVPRVGVHLDLLLPARRGRGARRRRGRDRRPRRGDLGRRSVHRRARRVHRCLRGRPGGPGELRAGRRGRPRQGRGLCRWLRTGRPTVVLGDDLQELFGGQRSFDWGPAETEGAVAAVPAFGPYGSRGARGAHEQTSDVRPQTPRPVLIWARSISHLLSDVCHLTSLEGPARDDAAHPHVAHGRPSDRLPHAGALRGDRRIRRRCARRSAMTPADVAAAVKASNIRGRGGAGFPTGVKWGFLPAATRPRYLVINADESEPGTFKDRQLLERDPHQLVEGIILSSYALDVQHAFIYIRGEYPRPARRVQRAVDEAYADGLSRATTSSAPASTSTSPSISAPGPTSAARRPRCSTLSRAGAASRASSLPSRRSRACMPSRPSSTTSRRSPTSRGWSSTAARPTRHRPGDVRGHPTVLAVRPRQSGRATTRS